MKRKIMNFIKEHKAFSVVLGIAIICFIILLVTFLMVFIGHGGSAYGDRLEGIEEVKLSNKKLENINDNLEAEEVVSSSKVRVQGKIVYVTIHFINGTNIEKAKTIATKVLEEFDEDELGFYDFEFLISEETSDDSEGVTFSGAGTKHYSKEEITWNKS